MKTELEIEIGKNRKALTSFQELGYGKRYFIFFDKINNIYK